jgi:hypothetical protein
MEQQILKIQVKLSILGEEKIIKNLNKSLPINALHICFQKDDQKALLTGLMGFS